MFKINKCLILFLPLIIFIFISCGRGNTNEQSFYYWKTVFELSADDMRYLNNLNINKIYLRFFDVDYDAVSDKIIPVAKVVIKTADINIIPVIYITQDALKHIKTDDTDALARKIIDQTDYMLNSNSIINISEIQIDCDWTNTTETIYFNLLNGIDRAAEKISKNIVISCTLRLHQVNLKNKTGIPPVNKTALMIYHTGDPAVYNDSNSIFDLNTAVNYLKEIDKYPLKTDIAISVFSWAVQYDSYRRFIRLLKNTGSGDILNNINFKKTGNDSYEAVNDTYLNDLRIMKGDIIKLESSDYESSLKLLKHLNNKLKKSKRNLLIYSYDKISIERFTNGDPDKIKKLFDSF